MQDLEAYAEGTYASLLYATLEGLGLRDTGLDHVASHVGKAEGIVAVIRGLVVLARAEGGGGAVVLPLDLCAEVGLRQEDVLRRAQGREGGGGEDVVGKLKEVVFRIATLANDHLITARKMIAEEPAARGVAFSGFMRAVGDDSELPSFLLLSCTDGGWSDGRYCRFLRRYTWKDWKGLTSTPSTIDFKDRIGSCHGGRTEPIPLGGSNLV